MVKLCSEDPESSAKKDNLLTPSSESTVMGTPNRNPKKKTRDIEGIDLSRSLHFCYVSSLFILGAPCLGSPLEFLQKARSC